MPGLMNGDHGSQKRKRAKDPKTPISSKRRATAVSKDDGHLPQIEFLESQIAESRRNYNNIVALISMIHAAAPTDLTTLPAAVSLCRVFVRLMSAGRLSRSRESVEQETVITAWLEQRYREYQNALLGLLQQPNAMVQKTTFTLIIRLIKQEALHLGQPDLNTWKTGLFPRFLASLIEGKELEQLRTDFVTQYILQFDDIRFYTFAFITEFASQDRSPEILENVLSLMTETSRASSSVKTCFAEMAKKVKDPIRSPTAHKRKAQEAWVAVLRNRLSVSQRKNLLRIMSHAIAPWFLRPELLMDFLTDSYNVGGATSLLALSGLFYLIREKNLDYPQFYHKLYSLLDADLVHSKHRSRFFRLLNTFLSSTHLPSALVASFIKRLSRLSLSSPPAGIVAIVPWIYNLLKEHPACTFMIHRRVNNEEIKSQLSFEGLEDPFDMAEPDPMLTDAIESSLWEIETLQSHYHPNVASLAQIISEQFTKQAYNMEDFLDHSYQSMLDAELGKEVKRVPVIEFQIPKRIFTDRGSEEDGGEDHDMLRGLWQFS